MKKDQKIMMNTIIMKSVTETVAQEAVEEVLERVIEIKTTETT